MFDTFSVLLLLFAGVVEPQPPAYAITPAAGAISIDGVIDPDEWSGIRLIELLFETSPGENTPAPVRTEAGVRRIEDLRGVPRGARNAEILPMGSGRTVRLRTLTGFSSSSIRRQ